MNCVPPPVRTASATPTAGAPASASQPPAEGDSDAFSALLGGLTGPPASATPTGDPAEAAGAAGSAEAAGESEPAAGTAAAKPTLLPDAGLACVPTPPLPAMQAFTVLPTPAAAATNSTDAGGTAAPAASAGPAGLPQAAAGRSRQQADLHPGAVLAPPQAAAPAAKAFGELATMLRADSLRAGMPEGPERTRLPEPVPLSFAAAPSLVDTARAPSDAAAVYRADMASAPQDPAFAGDLTAEVRFMMDSGVQQAELRLNPAELGPIHIQLSLSAQTADLSFSAAHAATREGISQALPALRDMLASQGLSLGQTGVAPGQDGRQPQPGQQQRRAASHPDGSGAAATASLLGVSTVRASRGMLDLYA